MFSPALLYLLLFVLFPVVYLFMVSTYDVSLLGTPENFIGMENYQEVGTDPTFQSSLWRNIIFAVGTVGFQVSAGVALALVLNGEYFENKIATTALRSFAILPYLVPLIAVVVMWRWILSPIFGVGNEVLVGLSLTDAPIDFFGTPEWAMPAVIIFGSWKFIAFVTLVILARLQAIDQMLYEQARISGASPIQGFWYITLPNLRSAILLVILLRAMWNFNQFSIIWLFTAGGPLSRTTTVPIYIYEITFQAFELGKGSASALTLFLVLIIGSIFYFKYFDPSQEIETVR